MLPVPTIVENEVCLPPGFTCWFPPAIYYGGLPGSKQFDPLSFCPQKKLDATVLGPPARFPFTVSFLGSPKIYYRKKTIPLF